MGAVEKTINVLEAFLKHQDGMGITELSRVSQVNISAAYRIASILVKRGYLKHRGKREKYSLTPKLLEFAPVIRQQLKIRDVAFPILDKLSKEINESVSLDILDRDAAICIEQFEPSHNLRPVTKVGNRFPLHCTAIGKILLAHLEDEEREKYVRANGLPHRTANTITNYDQLKKELRAIKQEGLAEDREEYEFGLKCIAAPIKDSSGKVVAAFSTSGPSFRLSNDRIREIRSLSEKCSLEISQALGYRIVERK